MLLQFDEEGLCIGESQFGTHASPDPEKTPFRWKLDSQGVVVDAFPDLEDDEVMDAYNQLKIQNDLIRSKAFKVGQVKIAASGYIESTKWKLERALERDAVNGTTEVNAVYAEREAIRQASNEQEARIMAANSEAELNGISVTSWWPQQ